jgi:hypothetical protein
MRVNGMFDEEQTRPLKNKMALSKIMAEVKDLAVQTQPKSEGI